MLSTAFDGIFVNFNTSHVSINLNRQQNFILYWDFNTSHVSINRTLGNEIYLYMLFQYISCFY